MSNEKEVQNKDEYIEYITNLAQNEWFEKHEAKLILNKDGVRIIEWQEPKEWDYKMKYVFIDGAIFITGDMGDAVYNWHNYNHLQAFKSFGLGYFTSKLTASEGEKYDFDFRWAEVELKENWEVYYSMDDLEDEDEESSEELKRMYEDQYEAIHDCIVASNSLSEYHSYLTQAYNNNEFNGEDMEWLWDLGLRLNPRIIGYWVGLQMALKQLIERGEI